jgi:hypothetical protein
MKRWTVESHQRIASSSLPQLRLHTLLLPIAARIGQARFFPLVSLSPRPLKAQEPVKNRITAFFTIHHFPCSTFWQLFIIFDKLIELTLVVSN